MSLNESWLKFCFLLFVYLFVSSLGRSPQQSYHRLCPSFHLPLFQSESSRKTCYLKISLICMKTNVLLCFRTQTRFDTGKCTTGPNAKCITHRILPRPFRMTVERKRVRLQVPTEFVFWVETLYCSDVFVVPI